MGSALFPGLSRLVGVPVSTVALMTSVWAFTGLLSPLFGPLSDSYGHRAFFLVGLGAFLLGNLLSAVAPSFPTLLMFQVPVGLGYAIFSFSASAVVGEVFAYRTRARAMGIVRFAVSMAALVGVPAAAAIADRLTARGSFAAVGGMGLVVLVVALRLLSGQSRAKAGIQPSQPRTVRWRVFVEVGRQRSVVAGLLVILIWAMIPTGVFIYLAAWLETAFRLTETQIGLALSMAGVGALIGNLLTATCADRLGKRRSSVVGLMVVSVAAMLLSRSPVLGGVLIGLVVFFAALEFGFASFSTLLTELAPEGRGTLMSLVSLMNGIGTGLVPIVMRPLSESGSYATITLVLGVAGLGTAVALGLFVAER